MLIQLVTLREAIKSLLDAPYFSEEIVEHIQELTHIADSTIENWGSLPPSIRSQICQCLWISHRYIAGNTSNEVPFEIQLTLKSALDDWLPAKNFGSSGITVGMIRSPINFTHG